MQTLYHRNANVMSQKRKRYIIETQTLYHRNANVISQKRKRYVVETQTLYHRNANVISQKRKRYVIETQTLCRRSKNVSTQNDYSLITSTSFNIQFTVSRYNSSKSYYLTSQHQESHIDQFFIIILLPLQFSSLIYAC